MLVGVCQGIARNLAPEAHVIKLGLLGTQTGFNIGETFAVGELIEGQTKELIPAGKFIDVAIALLAIDAKSETGRSGRSSRAERRRFGQDSFTASRTSQEVVTWGQTRSKKLKSKNFTETLTSTQSSSYTGLLRLSWDSTEFE